MAVALSFRHSPLDGSRAINNIRTPSIHMVTWHSVFFGCSFFYEGIFALCFLLPLSPEPYILKSERSDEEPNEKTRTGCATQRTLRTTSTSSLFCYVCFSAGRYRTVLVFSLGHVAKKCFGVSWNECAQSMAEEPMKLVNQGAIMHFVGTHQLSRHLWRHGPTPWVKSPWVPAGEWVCNKPVCLYARIHAASGAWHAGTHSRCLVSTVRIYHLDYNS